MVGEKQVHFPEVYAKLKTPELLEAYAAGPQRLRRVLEGLTEADLRAHPRPGKWSIKEIALHILDSEIIGAGRIRQAYAQPGSTFPACNQDLWTKVFDHQNCDRGDFEKSLQLFDMLRAVTTRLFRKATEKEWRQTGRHTEWGELTLRQLLELYADHSERHIEQILLIRELLGKPLQFPLLLKTRLY